MLSAPARTASRGSAPTRVARRTLTLVSGRPGDVELRTALPDPDAPRTDTNWQRHLEMRRQRAAFHARMSELGSTQTRENSWQPHHSLHRATAPGELTLSALVAAGAHYGHSKSLMNPGYTGYAYGVRSGIVVIDLEQTLPLLRRAANVVRGVAAAGGSIIFVGTKPELAPAARKAALRMGHNAYHVADAWMPGVFTNKFAMFGFNVAANVRVVPDLVVFLNPLQNMQGIRECALEHVPTIGIVDSNLDPRIVLYPIPANDDSIRTGELVAGVLSIAGREGLEVWREELKRRARVRDKDRVFGEERAKKDAADRFMKREAGEERDERRGEDGDRRRRGGGGRDDRSSRSRQPRRKESMDTLVRSAPRNRGTDINRNVNAPGLASSGDWRQHVAKLHENDRRQQQQKNNKS